MALNINESNFTTKLAGWKKATVNRRDELQEFIIFGVLHAQQNDNDFTLLSNILVACEEVKAFPNQDICDYIKKVISGVSWNVKGKVFKKANKKATIEYNIGYLESEAWYEFSKATKPAKDMDVINAAARWAKQLRENIDKGLIKNGQQEKAEDLLNTLVQFMG